MGEPRPRRLDEMDEQEVTQFLADLFLKLSPEEEYNLRHEDYIMEMPQPGERIRGRENMRAFQKSFADHSNPPSIRLRRVLVRDGLWILEGVNDYGGGQVFNVADIIELRNGKIWRDTRYYAERFEAPRRQCGGRSGSSEWNPKCIVWTRYPPPISSETTQDLNPDLS